MLLLFTAINDSAFNIDVFQSLRTSTDLPRTALGIISMDIYLCSPQAKWEYDDCNIRLDYTSLACDNYLLQAKGSPESHQQTSFLRLEVNDAVNQGSANIANNATHIIT